MQKALMQRYEFLGAYIHRRMHENKSNTSENSYSTKIAANQRTLCQYFGDGVGPCQRPVDEDIRLVSSFIADGRCRALPTATATAQLKLRIASLGDKFAYHISYWVPQPVLGRCGCFIFYICYMLYMHANQYTICTIYNIEHTQCFC